MRLSEGTLPTDYAFTGQKQDSHGLLFCQARYYDAALGRFAQAGTIVPAPFQPQSLNRYSSGLNNPVKYTDPTRHAADSGGGGCPDCWEELFEAYAKVAHAAEPQAFRGTQKEYRGAVAVYYYNLWQYGPDSPATQASYDMLEVYQTRLAVNYRYGEEEARNSAYLAAGGEGTIGAALTVGIIDLGKNGLGMGPVASGAAKVGGLSDEIIHWLGPGSRMIKNTSGDWVFISKDETRRVRFDFNQPRPHENSHVHVEEKVNDKWVKSGPLYPTDVKPK